MRRRRHRALVATAILLGFLLHTAAFASAAATTRNASTPELTTRPLTDAALALPSKRLPDVAKPDRAPRPIGWSRVETARCAARAPGLVQPLRAAATMPHRARSHALRLRLRPPDDPLQATVPA